MHEEYKKQLEKFLNSKHHATSKFEVENNAGEEIKLNIYGFIGGWENSSERVLRKIENYEGDRIHVHLNSGGGSAFDGIAICNMLKRHKAEIVVHIDGWAASAASIIAMAGDKIIMPSNTMMMIHHASTIAYGNAEEFEKTAKDLRQIDKAVTATYENRFVGSSEELTELLAEETFLTAEEAVAIGLADEITDEIEIVEDEAEVEEDEEEYDNAKEKVLAKYSASNRNEQKPKEKEPARNISRLFLFVKK